MALLNRDELPDPIVSDNALQVLKERYLAKDSEGEIVEDPKGMYIRNAEAVASAEETEEKKVYYAREFYDIMSQGLFLPNSPCLMNAGRELGMLSACFVLGIEDDLESILDTLKAMALVQRAGGGTGFDFSKLRPNGSVVASSGGTTSGPISFVNPYSVMTAAIQQGAFRRGANMGVLRVDHPDIIDFIKAKSDLSRWQNYNVSVAITDDFMEQLKCRPHSTHKVSHSKWGEGFLAVRGEEIVAHKSTDEHVDSTWAEWTYKDTWDLICQRAWETGEPGLFFVDTANKDNPIPNVGRIHATNPCGEQCLHDWDSCNLGSINLSKLFEPENMILKKGTSVLDHFNWDGLTKVVQTAVRFLDNVISINKYPIPELEEMALKTRRIGLGVMGWADLLFQLQIPYDSEEARKLAKDIQQHISKVAKNTSSDLGYEKGCFGAWDGSIYGASEEAMENSPMRNSYRTTVAPTGTISIIADCSGGIEPLYALSFTRTVMPDNDGNFKEMTETNKHFLEKTERLPFKEDLLSYVEEHGNLAGYHYINPDWDFSTKIFKTAHEIAPEDHVKMQAAWQEHVDSAISKTINLNNDTTPEDVSKAYHQAYELGCKGITVYRDGCRNGVAGMKQPMSVKVLTKEEIKEIDCPFPPEEGYEDVNMPQLPEDGFFQTGVYGFLNTPFGTLHVNIVINAETFEPTKVFAQIGKGGNIVTADLEAICRLTSRLLSKPTGTIEEVIDQLSGIGSTEIMPSEHGKIVSLADALAKVLRRYQRTMMTPSEPVAEVVADEHIFVAADAAGSTLNYELHCPSPGCHRLLYFSEGCKRCNCGYSTC
jgi:ribonucleoside-diphosphate reductase alpha chain